MVKAPEKVGERRVIMQKFGKSVFFQDYQMPTDGTRESFLLARAAVIPVIGMPVTVDGEVVLVRQFRYGVDDFVEEFPGGCPEPGQSSDTAMRTELLEETGYGGGTIVPLGDPIAFDPAWYNAKFIPYLIKGCSYRQPPEFNPTEHLEVFRMPLWEFAQQIVTGKFIRDAKTLTTALLALPRLGFALKMG